jgi:hypothetical protein
VSADGSLLNEVDDRHERQRRAELYAEVIEDLPEVAEERIECLSAVPDVEVSNHSTRSRHFSDP